MRKAPIVLIVGIFFFFILNQPFTYAQEEALKRAVQLNQQAMQLYNQGKYDEAVYVAEEVLAILEKALGPDHREVATCQANLAEFYKAQGDYAKVEQLINRSLAIREKALGPDHPDVANSLQHIAVFYHFRGDYAKAEPLFKRSLAIFEKVLGFEHPDVATSLNNLAQLYYTQGDYARAEPLFKRSLAIREKALGPNHIDVASSLNSLAVLYDDQSYYAEAEPFYKRSLGIREKALGFEHPDVATSLNNLASLYYTQDDYARAEPLFKRSLAIREKALGPGHIHVAQSLNNLALLYYVQGDYTKAEPLFKRSLAIFEKALGYEHPNVATSLNNLAQLYYTQGDHTKAEPLYKRSLAIWEKALGPGHINVATNLNNLAMYYVSLADYAKAEPLYKRSLDIREKELGSNHPDVAVSLNNLAELCRLRGDYAKAEPLYKRALAIFEKSLGSDHSHVARSLNNLAVVYAAQGDFSTAHLLVIRAQKIDEKLIDQIIGFTSESRQMLFLNTRQGNLEMALSLIALHLRDYPNARKDALDIWLRRKGVVLEGQRRFQEALVYSDDPEIVAIFQELAMIRSQLSQMTFGGYWNEGPKAYQEKVAGLEGEKRKLGAKLSTLSKTYALRKKIERADSTKVAQALPTKAALLEFVRINIFDFKAMGKDRKWLPARYFAFVLHSGKGDRVEMIDLGDAGEIEKAVTQLKREIADTAGKQASKGSEISRRIHSLVFEPVKNALGGVKEIYISPDGNLNLIPFEVLQNPDGKFLIEDYTFNYLAAGRDIIGFGQIKEKGGKALLIGDPDFDLGSEEKGATLRKLALTEASPQNPARRSSEMIGFSFQRLPGTSEEVEGIKRLLGDADMYTDREALEEVLKHKDAPCILHLATHGFFLSDPDLSVIRYEGIGRGIKMVKSPAEVEKGLKVENPLLRSGIALAGANSALQSGETAKSDGLVTAEKILGLRLRGTDMVVLSACETGLGEVKSGEGVYGLRRAFIQAGTKGLVMSMWSVPDFETKELMLEFYQNILSGKTNRVQALRQAALKQMNTVKSRYGSTNPFYWGAFVYLGEP